MVRQARTSGLRAYAAAMPTGPRRSGGPPRPGSEERVAAALVGSGPSQLGVDGSMRARDVSRPTEDDAARAERVVQVSYRPRSKPRPLGPAGSQPEGTGGSSPDAS